MKTKSNLGHQSALKLNAYITTYFVPHPHRQQDLNVQNHKRK